MSCASARRVSCSRALRPDDHARQARGRSGQGQLAEKARPGRQGRRHVRRRRAVRVGAFATLTVCLIALLTTVVDRVWLAALIVTVVYAAVAGVLAMTGKQKVTSGQRIPGRHETALKEEDVRWAKTRAKSGMT